MNAVALASLLAVQWAEPPAFSVGDRVRVHVLEQPAFLGIPLPRLQRTAYGGTITFYAEHQSIALERDEVLFFHPAPKVIELHWSDVARIDVPSGRAWLVGAAAGAEAAFFGAVGVAFLCAIAGGNQPDAAGCPFWKNAARFALVTVPVGALVGSQFTHWKPVYRRKR